jgi:hypothetical protein
MKNPSDPAKTRVSRVNLESLDYVVDIKGLRDLNKFKPTASMAKVRNDPSGQKESKQSKFPDGASGKSNWIEYQKIILEKLKLCSESIANCIMINQQKINSKEIFEKFLKGEKGIDKDELSKRYRKALNEDREAIEIARLIELCTIENELVFKENFPRVREHIKFLDDLIIKKNLEIAKNKREFSELQTSLALKLETETKAKLEAEAKVKGKGETKVKGEGEAKIKLKPDKKLTIKKEKTKQEVIEEVKTTVDNIILKVLKLIEEKAKIKEEEEKARIAAEEKTKLETEKEAKRLEKERRKIEYYKKIALDSAQEAMLSEIAFEVTSEFLSEDLKEALDEVKAEEKLCQEFAEKTRIEEEKLREKAEGIKDRILEKTSANFEKFQSFFDFLREKSWLDIGEIGLFGSRVYKEVINETCPSLKMPENSQADFDFFCIPDKEKSRGIFALCHQESASKENFQEIIEEFNAKNPNLQISFLEDRDGKKSVNFNRLKKSLNFKLVATFFEDEVGEEKAEQTVKEKIEFDLNFYTQQSMLENLQWQFNIERVMLSQVSDGSVRLKINQSNCNPSQEKMTIEKFITEAQNSEQQDFLFEANPQARGFLNRIINAKGIYKYLDEETLDAIKIKLLTNTEIKENLKNELLNYKNLADRDVSEPRNSSEIQEKIEQAKLIIEKVKADKIFKEDKDFQEILQRSPKTTPTQASVSQKSKERF